MPDDNWCFIWIQLKLTKSSRRTEIFLFFFISYCFDFYFASASTSIVSIAQHAELMLHWSLIKPAGRLQAVAKATEIHPQEVVWRLCTYAGNKSVETNTSPFFRDFPPHVYSSHEFSSEHSNSRNSCCRVTFLFYILNFRISCAHLSHIILQWCSSSRSKSLFQSGRQVPYKTECISGQWCPTGCKLKSVPCWCWKSLRSDLWLHCCLTPSCHCDPL